MAILDVLRSPAALPGNLAESPAALTLTQARDHLALFPHPWRDTISPLLALSEDIEDLRIEIQRWYERAMERTTELYKRSNFLTISVFSLIITIGLNLDTFGLAKNIFNSTAVRQSAIEAAKTEVSSAGATGESNEIWQAVERTRQRTSSLKLGLGWEDGAVAETSHVTQRDRYWYLWKAAGLLCTTLAGTFGAHFCFDTLNRFMGFRSAIKPASQFSRRSVGKEVAMPEGIQDTIDQIQRTTREAVAMEVSASIARTSRDIRDEVKVTTVEMRGLAKETQGQLGRLNEISVEIRQLLGNADTAAKGRAALIADLVRQMSKTQSATASQFEDMRAAIARLNEVNSEMFTHVLQATDQTTKERHTLIAEFRNELAKIEVLASSQSESVKAAIARLEDSLNEPILNNYRGYLCASLKGQSQPQTEDASEPKQVRPIATLEVSVSRSKLPEAIAEEVLIEGGTDAAIVIFDVLVQSLDFSFSKRRGTIEVGPDNPNSISFEITSAGASENGAIDVQLLQKNRLIQIVRMENIVLSLKEANPIIPPIPSENTSMRGTDADEREPLQE